MKFARLPLALALLLPLIAIADSPPRAKMQVQLKQFDVNSRDFTFPSGFRVIFQEDHSQPIVSLTMTVDHGSQDDPEGLEGMAHLIEHLWFRSLHKDKDGKDLPKVMDLIKQMGADFNATTSTDRTNYLTSARRENLPLLMFLESIRLHEPIRGVTNQDLLIEREVVRNELRLGYENAGQSAFDFIGKQLYPKGHPLARDTIGVHDTLNAITLADIQKYVDSYYHPSESTLVVVGDFKLDDSSKLLEAFSIDQLAAKDDPKGEKLALIEAPRRLSGPAPEPPPANIPVEVKGEVVNLPEYPAGVEKPALILAWSLPAGYRDTDVLAQQAVGQLHEAVANEIFSQDDYQKSLDRGERNGFGCFHQAGRYASTAYCYIEMTDVKDAAKTAETALNGIYRIYNIDEYTRQYQSYLFDYGKTAQQAYVLHTADEVENIFGGRAAVTSDFAHFTGDVQYYSKMLDWSNNFDADQVRKFAEKYFDRRRAAGVVVKPYEDGEILIDSSDAGYRGASLDVSMATLLEESQVTPAIIHDTLVTPDVKKIVTEKLASGVEFIAMHHSEGPLVQVAIQFDGGSMSRGADRMKWVFAGAMNANQSYPKINDQGSVVGIDPLKIAGSGGGTNGMIGALTSGTDITASAGNVTDAVYILRARLDNLIAYTSGRIDWIKEQKDDITAWQKKPDDWATSILLERVFPGHPIGHWFTHKEWDEANKLGADTAQKVLAQILQPENTRLFIVGNTTIDEARAAATTYFGGWSGWAKKPAGWVKPSNEIVPPPEPPARQVLLFNKDNVSQTSVQYACQMNAVNDENQWVASIMADVITDHTWLALREETGVSYGAYAGAQTWWGGAAMLTMGVSVQNDTTAQAVKVFLDLGERAKAGTLDARMTAIQRFNNAQQYVLFQQSTAAMLGRLMWVKARGLNWDYFEKIGDRLAAVKPSDYTALMQRCVGHEVIVAVGPVAVIQPQFEKLGITVEVIDAKLKAKEYRAAMGLKEPKEEKKKDEKKK